MFESDSDKEQIPLQKQLVFPRQINPYFKNIPKLSDFQIVKFISKGAFGKVEQYFSPEKNEMFAIKRIKYKDQHEDQNIRQIKRQIESLYKINSQYIMRLYDHFEDEENAYLIMEYIDGKNLYDGILKPKKELPFKIICAMIEEICLGLEQMHRQKLIHRDLKLQNIMMFNGTIKIIDLGESNHFGEGIIRKTRRGTKSYFSPQILNTEQQDDRIDSWCLGVIIYELICLKSPFASNISVESDLDQNIRRIKYTIPQKIKHENQLIDLFKKVFAYKNQRIRVEQIRTHPFMKKYLNQNAPQLKFENLFDEKKIGEYRKKLESAIEKYKSQIYQLARSNEEIESEIEEVEKNIFFLRQDK